MHKKILEIGDELCETVFLKKMSVFNQKYQSPTFIKLIDISIFKIQYKILTKKKMTQR